MSRDEYAAFLIQVSFFATHGLPKVIVIQTKARLVRRTKDTRSSATSRLAHRSTNSKKKLNEEWATELGLTQNEHPSKVQTDAQVKSLRLSCPSPPPSAVLHDDASATAARKKSERDYRKGPLRKPRWRPSSLRKTKSASTATTQ